MRGDSRDQIMARLRRAGRHSAAEAEQKLVALGGSPAPGAANGDLARELVLNIRRNQGTVDAVEDKAAAVGAIATYLRQHFRTQRLVAGADPRLAALPWRNERLLPRFGAAEDGDPVALSYAVMGVAETGSILLYSGREDPAANRLLPEAHLVLVDTTDIVAGLGNACARMETDFAGAGRPRGIAMSSGPSSTADIEFTLVQGAHGPRQWHVILVGKGAGKALQ